MHAGISRRHTRARTVAALTAVTAAAVLSLDAGGPPAQGTSEARTSPSSSVVDLPGARGELVLSSFLGGQEWDEATGVATDRDGNSYLTGFTLSTDFPTVGRGARGHEAIVDAFVTKVAADRGRVVWSTQLGGVDMDSSNAVTVDRAGNVYVVGRTGSPDFPTTLGRHRPKGRSCTGEPCHDAFVTKLDARGRTLWSTRFGGSMNEEAMSVAVDRVGAVYVTGLTDSSDLPVRRALQRRFQSPPCPGDVPCPYDAFVAKIAPRGDRLVYSTYLGGKAADVGRGIVVDDEGSAYVVGSTSSPDFPTARSFQGGLRGRACGPPPGEPCRQAFLTKLGPGGRAASYSTLLGGRQHDDGYGVAVDGRHRAYVTGSTQSPDFPTRRAVQARMDDRACTSEQPLELCDDGFLTQFTPSGRRLGYSTYLGGGAEDQGLAVDVSARGDALVAGRTDSVDLVVSADAVQPTFGGSIDGFAARFGPNGTRVWSTFVGGSEADRSTGVAWGRSGSAHITGRTLSPDFPKVRPFQGSLRDSDYDAFLSVIK